MTVVLDVSPTTACPLCGEVFPAFKPNGYSLNQCPKCGWPREIKNEKKDDA